MSLQLNSLIMSDKQAGMEVIMAESIIKVENLVKSFGDHEVLKKIDFEISKGEVVCIIGSSGSGKSTLLRCINHLETPTGGKILFHGEEVKNTQSSLSKYRSQVGMVFQSFNLFNNMTVLKNCMFGVQKILHLSKEEAKLRAIKHLREVGMAAYINAKPAQLSGGQKQRVAIARALASDPKILLCDEATSALDPQTTSSILELLKKINRQFGITIVIITHQMSVVREICTHVAIMYEGEVVEKGLVADIFANPQSEVAKELIRKDTGSDIDADSRLDAGREKGQAEIKSGEKIRIVFLPLLIFCSFNLNVCVCISEDTSVELKASITLDTNCFFASDKFSM